MKNFRILSLTLIILMSAIPAFGQIVFKDVPEDHWAKWAVNDLVKLGITQGYPDGTFRGNRNITRYETAIFLAKLAAAIGEGKTEEVDLSSIKADIQAIKEEIAALRKAPEEKAGGIPISGSFMSRFRIANLFAGGTVSTIPVPKGPRFDYRVKTTLSKDLGKDASVKINFDTMDAGFNSGAQDIATRLLDAEGKLKINLWGDNPVGIKVTAGPGPVVYSATQDAIIPSEVGTVYMRPRNSIILSTTLGGMDISGGYIVRTISSSGEVIVDQVTLTVGYNFVNVPVFGALKIAGTGDYVAENLFGEDGNKAYDGRGKVEIGAIFNDKVQSDLTFGLVSSDDPAEGNYFGWGLSLIDPWDSGTIMSLKLHNVGAEYLSPSLLTAEADMIGLDYFDKYITNNSIDIGGEIAQILSESFTLKGKFDYRYTKGMNYGEDDPASNSTLETALSYNIAPSATLDLIYKIYQVPSKTDDKTTDLLGLVFLYKF